MLLLPGSLAQMKLLVISLTNNSSTKIFVYLFVRLPADVFVQNSFGFNSLQIQFHLHLSMHSL